MKFLGLIIISSAASLLGATQVQAASPYYNNGVYPADQQCREFTQTIYVGGRPQQGFGTACLQHDGSWKVVSKPQLPATLPSQTVPLREVIVQENHYYPASTYRPSYGYGYGYRNGYRYGYNNYPPRSGITISLGNHHRPSRYYKHRDHRHKQRYSRHRDHWSHR